MANIIAKPPADKFLRSSPYGPLGYKKNVHRRCARPDDAHN